MKDVKVSSEKDLVKSLVMAVVIASTGFGLTACGGSSSDDSTVVVPEPQPAPEPTPEPEPIVADSNVAGFVTLSGSNMRWK